MNPLQTQANKTFGLTHVTNSSENNRPIGRGTLKKAKRIWSWIIKYENFTQITWSIKGCQKALPNSLSNPERWLWSVATAWSTLILKAIGVPHWVKVELLDFWPLVVPPLITFDISRLSFTTSSHMWQSLANQWNSWKKKGKLKLIHSKPCATNLWYLWFKARNQSIYYLDLFSKEVNKSYLVKLVTRKARPSSIESFINNNHGQSIVICHKYTVFVEK